VEQFFAYKLLTLIIEYCCDRKAWAAWAQSLHCDSKQQ